MSKWVATSAQSILRKRAKARRRIELKTVRVIVTRQDGKILLVRRSLQDRSQPGLWEVPGGKVDSDNETLAVRRELSEETGLRVRGGAVLLRRHRQIPRDGSRQGYNVVTKIYMVAQWDGSVALSAEHDSYEWVYVSEATQKPATRATLAALRALTEYHKRLPAPFRPVFEHLDDVGRYRVAGR